MAGAGAAASSLVDRPQRAHAGSAGRVATTLTRVTVGAPVDHTTEVVLERCGVSGVVPHIPGKVPVPVGLGAAAGAGVNLHIGVGADRVGAECEGVPLFSVMHYPACHADP